MMQNRTLSVYFSITENKLNKLLIKSKKKTKIVLTPSQGILGIIRHCIGFVQNDQLESATEDRAGGGEIQDLTTNDVDATVIGSVQLQHH